MSNRFLMNTIVSDKFERIDLNIIISKLENEFSLNISPGEEYYYDSLSDTVFYIKKEIYSVLGYSSFLHEASHAILGHINYKSELELLATETRAWELAIKIAHTFDIKIPEKLISSSLESYESFALNRGLCPTCNRFIISSMSQYQCLFCNTKWSCSQSLDTKKTIY